METKDLPFYPFTEPVPHISIDENLWEISNQTTHFVEIRAKPHKSILRFLGCIAPIRKKGDVTNLLQKMKDQGFILIKDKYDWEGLLVFERVQTR